MDGTIGQTHEMWITLFDDQGDDEYDGAMGLNDDEDPRVLMGFKVTQIPEPAVVEPPPVRKSIPEKPKTSTQANYLNPIKNQRGKRDSDPITPGRTVNKVASKPIAKPTSATRQSRITKPIARNPVDVSREPISSTLGRLAPV